MATPTGHGNGNGASHKGKITQVIGPVVDVEFAAGKLPEIYTALTRHQPRHRRPTQDNLDARGRAAPRREHGPRASPWTRPTAWCAAWRCTNTGAPITMPVGPEVPRPHPQRHRRAGRRARPGQRQADAADPPRAADVRRPVDQGRDRSRPASRSSTCSPPTARAARSASSAAPASARPCSSWSSSTTSPRSTAAFSCFAGVGERTREGNDLCHEMTESKLVDGEPVLSKTALVYGQMNEPPGARARVALSALTVAEYFRDEEGQDVLLFVDNIFRFTQAGSEVSALLGRIPSAVGYQPTLSTEMGALQERITSTNKGSITSVQAIYVPADDLTDPAPATTFAHLDATTVLSRAHHRARHLPGRRSARLDLDASSTRTSSARSTTTCARDVQRIAAALQGPAGHHRHPRHGRALARTTSSSSRARARSSASCRSRSSSPQPFTGTAGQVRRRSRTPSAASRRSSTASTTTCPSRPSTWSAPSTRPSEKGARLIREAA